MKNITSFRLFIIFISLFLVSSLFPLHASASDSGVVKPKENKDAYADIEKKWGIKAVVIRLTGSDHFLDFRFRVTNAEKAQPVLNKQKKAFLKDQETGKVYSVPVTKIGTLRSTAVKPKENRQYFILFANSDKAIKKGKKVSVIIDEFKVENLTVE